MGLRAGAGRALGSRLWAQALISGSLGCQWGPGILGVGPTLAVVAQGSPTRLLRTPSAGPQGSTSPSPVLPLGNLTTRGESGCPASPGAPFSPGLLAEPSDTAERPEGLGLTWYPGARKSGHSWVWAQCCGFQGLM